MSGATTGSLPGADLIERGLADLASGRLSEEALLVAIGAPRLRSLGYAVPVARSDGSPEHMLYTRLARHGATDAHSRYNALIRRLVSYERALELNQSRAARIVVPRPAGDPGHRPE